MKPSQKELFRWADQIPAALWTDLRNRSPRQAAEAVGAAWDGETFQVPMIGIDYTIDPANQKITRTHQADHRVSFQTAVVLLSALTNSKGVPPSGRMAVPQELPGGRMFFTGAHALATGPLAKNFEKDPGRLTRRALEFGGEMIKGADVAIRMPGLPYVPLYVLLWRGDQEFPGRAVIGIDDRAHFHLDLASVLALTNILVYRVCKDD
ncbi:MAG: DUF3786 domain-containing protein [Desulfosalsimonadaceae bacterium]